MNWKLLIRDVILFFIATIIITFLVILCTDYPEYAILIVPLGLLISVGFYFFYLFIEGLKLFKKRYIKND